MKKMTIGQMARMNGISEQTLRLYDREGLFSPAYRNRDTGIMTSGKTHSWIGFRG